MQNNQNLITKLQRDAYVKEFRFLERYIDQQIGFEVTVKRIDEQLMTEDSFFKVQNGTSIVHHSQRITFLDECGAELLVVGQEKRSFIQKLFRSAKEKVSVQETVGEALFRLGETVDKVHYILQERYNRFTIYKLPKGFTLRGWMGKLIEEGQKKLNAELTETNKVILRIP